MWKVSDVEALNLGFFSQIVIAGSLLRPFLFQGVCNSMTVGYLAGKFPGLGKAFQLYIWHRKKTCQPEHKILED